MKNLLLVESENDKLFFEAIIKNLGNEYRMFRRRGKS